MDRARWFPRPGDRGAQLVAAQKAAKIGIAIARLSLRCTLDPAPEHCGTSKHGRAFADAVQRAGRHEQQSGTHEILPVSVPHPAGVDAVLAGPHRPQVDKA